MGIVFPYPVAAFVSPDQVLVLVNSKISESRDLATYYMERRGIPGDNRVDLDLPMTDTISRNAYEQAVLNPITDRLQKNGLANRIKVLVTMYGIPLRVQGPQPTSQEEEWVADARGWRQSAIGLLREQEELLVQQVSSLSQDPPLLDSAIIPPAETGKDISSSQVQAWRQKFTNLLQARVEKIERNASVEEKDALMAAHAKIIHRVFGKVGTSTSINGIPPLSKEQQREKVAVQQMLGRLMQQPSSATRTHAYELVQTAFGLWGVLSLSQWEMERYRQVDGSASLDSELSFLWWEPGTYPLAGRLPNPFYLGYAGTVSDWPLPLLMVSRIDAPMVAQAKKMVDQAISTESEGLVGNVYVDARGMKKGSPLSYGFYDADMQNFAHTFRKVAQYPLTLENTEKRFTSPGQAPNVAMYVGWYRLRHYEDAFTFNPGAIGYHIASGEAVSIHNPKELGWCKNALERGITVTLGPVGEPYLDAFPLPTEFFGLLYSGKYSLVEAYYLSTRYLSWKMVLFGDPLYRPWYKADAEQQQAAQVLFDHRPYPVSPAQVVFPALGTASDQSTFPGKYEAFDARILGP